MKRSLSSTNTAGLGRIKVIRSNLTQAWAAAILVAAVALGASPLDAIAARVSGVLTEYEGSVPLASRDLHFQNVITGDIFLSPTHSDGSFRASLPPGMYRLRTETGVVLLNSIVVDRSAIDLGHVKEQAPLAPQRLWQFQSIAPARLASPAPSTAYIKTSDTTPIPPTATAVPKPEYNWTRPPPETQASQGPNSVTGMATAPLPPQRTPSAMTPRQPGAMGAAPFSSSPATSGGSSMMP